MGPYPSPILRHILTNTLRNRSIAYLRLDRQATLLDANGQLELFGLGDLESGKPINEQLFLLEGLIPHDGPSTNLPSIEMPSGIRAEVHIFSADDHDWVMILDSEHQQIQRRDIQQKSHELSLLREKQSRILDQYLGKFVARHLAEGFNIEKSGERREVTIVFADIRDFTSFSEKYSPDEVFNVLNDYLEIMIDPILDEFGFVDKIIGDAVMAIFGMMPTILSPQSHAIKAAVKMINAVRNLNRSHAFMEMRDLEVAVGIATGPVALGILGNEERKTFSAIGHHVNLASRLEGMARHNEILIDRNTHARIGDYQNSFKGSSYSIKGIGARTPIYSWLVK